MISPKPVQPNALINAQRNHSEDHREDIELITDFPGKT
jgi:hypothetical protein